MNTNKIKTLPGPTNLCKAPITLIVAFLVAGALDCRPISLQKSIKSYTMQKVLKGNQKSVRITVLQYQSSELPLILEVKHQNLQLL